MKLAAMAREVTRAHYPQPKSEALVRAEAALAEAQALPWGPERLKALQEAGSLRNAAINLELKAESRSSKKS
jgi:hypothetical protein